MAAPVANDRIQLTGPAHGIRVFYDVAEKAVEVLAIVPKSEVEAWLEKHGERQ